MLGRFMAYEITSTTQPPYAAICYIRAVWSDGTAARSSGVVVGPNDVLTALHALYDGTRGWATQVTVVPAADTSPWLAPYGEFSDVTSMVGRAGNWDLNGDGLLTASESQGDLALIGLGTRIGDITGWLPVLQQPNDFYGTLAGYPGRGTGLMVEDAWADASLSSSTYSVQTGLGPGASGGPLLFTSGGVTSVAGVLSSGTAALTSSTYAGLFANGNFDWLQAAMSANDAAPGAGQLIEGTPGDDARVGGIGNDRFVGHGGNDSFDGGLGVDTAVFIGTRAQYGVSVAGTITVSDLVGGRDGIDTLRNVERASFSDVSLAFDVDGNAGQAYRLYRAALERAPEAAGLGYHIRDLDNGALLVQVAGNFIASPEFQARYGSLSDAQFVDQLYANVLGRAPDAQGFAYHTNNLANGFTRADVLVGFSESPENKAAVIGAIQGGMEYTI
jgi:V8-like Glu-specific endopeptidase